MPIPTGAVATLRRSGDTSDPTRITLSADADEATHEVDPGWYVIDLATADGRFHSADVEVKSGATVEANLDLTARARGRRPEATAVATVEIPLDNRPGATSSRDESARRTWFVALGAPESKVVAGGEGDDRLLLAPIPPPSSLVSAPRKGADRRVAEAVTIAPSEGTGMAFAIVDQEAQRLGSRTGAQPTRPCDWPAWLAVAGPGWREIAAVPSLGVAGRFLYDAADCKDPWVPEFRVQPRPRVASSQVEIHVPTRQWSGLLAFLGLRDFERSAVVFDALLAQTDIRTALLDRIDNPLAAIAGALVAVATRRLEAARIPEQWLSNLDEAVSRAARWSGHRSTALSLSTELRVPPRRGKSPSSRCLRPRRSGLFAGGRLARAGTRALRRRSRRGEARSRRAVPIADRRPTRAFGASHPGRRG